MQITGKNLDMVYEGLEYLRMEYKNNIAQAQYPEGEDIGYLLKIEKLMQRVDLAIEREGSEK